MASARVGKRVRKPHRGAWILLVLSIGGLACDSPHHAPQNEHVGLAEQAISSGGSATFGAGSLIIPMDTTYQDRGMLRAFGLVYRLLQNGVPVSWVIRRGKAYGGADFTASATNFRTSAVIASHGYRGGPFVIDAGDAARATPIVAAWQTTYPDTTVHVASASFSGYVRVQLVAAPNIAMFADGNQDIARGYMQAAGIPDSTGSLAWPDAGPDMLDPVEVAGPTTASHHDGALFDADGHPVYCQMMSMHWSVADANRPAGQEVVAEYRDYLRYPTHLFAECQAVNAIENNVFGHFLTPNGFVIGARPSSYEFFNADLPFAQLDGPFTSVGGSEPSYSLPAGDRFLDGDVVMISGGAAGTGTQDVWMTGFVGGGCSILSESCDPTISQGKVSYLGGHRYDTALPISTNASTQGTRLFLNSLFEAPCATDTGQPSVTVSKSGPAVVTSASITWTLTYSNAGPGTALGAVLRDTLPSGASFTSASGGGVWDGTRVTWNLGNLGPGESGVVTVTASLSSFGSYTNSSVLSYRSGLTPFSVPSGNHTTCYHPPSDPSACAGSGSATARACSDGSDDDGDGRVDYPTDPGCHSINDDDESDPAGTASDVDARLLVVFDTSGSMNWNTCTSEFTGGDGSLECPGSDVACTACSASGCGNGAADDSRLARARRGISDAVTAFGEVEYALMRFHQVPVGFSCPTRNANRASGAWLGAGASPCTGFDSGDVIVSFDRDNVRDLLEWTDGRSNAQSGNPAPGEDYELRGSGNTPLAGSLGSALTYLSGVEAVDRAAGCRPYVVVLITDGIETCAGNPVSRADALRLAGYPVHVIGFAVSAPSEVAQLDAIAAAGGTTRAIVVDDSTSLSAALASIVASAVLVEACNGADDDCDTRIDEGFTLYCDRQRGISSPTQCTDPGETVCDGIDDNCDGRTDEALRNRCGACGPEPAERCNRLDDDCDGAIDEGGVCAGCVPETEVCDALDNDCDLQIDEAITRPCGTDVGACTVGIETCTSGAFGACTGTGPSPETCNGIDDDCDGATDGQTRPCGTDVGACTSGVETCTAGAFGACTGARGPSAEICNAIDDDCDGTVDEGNPGGGAACGSAIGTCRRGTLSCSAGVLTCSGGVGPTAETCNGLDDDCDGAPDDGVPPGGACGSCGNGVLRCVSGAMSCAGDRSPSSELCNGRDDDCDGTIDEGNPGGGTPCGDDTGECASGTTLCSGGALVCDGGIAPREELCNALDDDCDGVPDDGLSVGAPCGTDVGECVPGALICRDGAVVCDGSLGPSEEICNALDDDCDGALDEDVPAGGACGSSMGACVPGRIECVSGLERCVGEVPTEREVCDCDDDDCDGLIDEPPDTGSLCPPETACIDCDCSPLCRESEFGRCAEGRVPVVQSDGTCRCQRPRCEDDRCAGETHTDPTTSEIVCAPDRSGVPICACVNNECTFPCSGVNCSAPLVCHPQRGNCVCDDCTCLGCPSGEACDRATRTCVVDRCATAGCASDQACRDGVCETSCAEVVCSEGERCVRGECAPDACARASCRDGELCDPGTGECARLRDCSPTCSAGSVCDRLTGSCIQDACAGLRCPDGQTCRSGECAAAIAARDAGPGERDSAMDAGQPILHVVAAGGGGCLCRAGAGAEANGGAAAIAMIAIAIAIRRRAR